MGLSCPYTIGLRLTAAPQKGVNLVPARDIGDHLSGAARLVESIAGWPTVCRSSSATQAASGGTLFNGTFSPPTKRYTCLRSWCHTQVGPGSDRPSSRCLLEWTKCGRRNGSPQRKNRYNHILRGCRTGRVIMTAGFFSEVLLYSGDI
jgi:hypothetical protein